MAKGNEKVIILGVDGATWDLIDPLIARGELPHFRELKERGAWGEVQTTYLGSPVIWTAIFAWVGVDVWHGRRVLLAVGLVVPITLAWAAIGFALSLASGEEADIPLEVSLALMLGGLLAAVFLIRAAAWKE